MNTGLSTSHLFAVGGVVFRKPPDVAEGPVFSATKARRSAAITQGTTAHLSHRLRDDETLSADRENDLSGIVLRNGSTAPWGIRSPKLRTNPTGFLKKHNRIKLLQEISGGEGGTLPCRSAKGQ